MCQKKVEISLTAEFPLDWLVDGDKLKTQPTDLIHGKYMYIEYGLGVGKRCVFNVLSLSFSGSRPISVQIYNY